MVIKDLKEQARNSLEGKYKEAIITYFLYLGISIGIGLLVSIVSLVAGFSDQVEGILSSCGSLAVTGLFSFGMISFYLKLSRNEEVTRNELFSKTNMFVPYIFITCLVCVFTTLWTLLLIIPGIIAAFSYSQVYLVALDNPEMDAMEVIKESKRIMKGHKWEYFVLNLSFIGWIILGIFTLGILYFWLMPYMSVTQCNFYNSIKDKAA